MIHEAQHHALRGNGQPIPDEALWRYPMPDWLGLRLDPKERATVLHVIPGSSADKDGFQVKDEILSLAGQPIVALADIQWVLDRARDGDALPVEVRRAGKMQGLKLSLPPGWRRKGEFTWRTSTWDLRRAATGGLFCETMTAAEHTQSGLSADSLALKVRHVGQFGPHQAAKNAGFLRDDILVEFDGLKQPMTESELLAYVLQKKKPGDKMNVTVQRGGKRLTLVLPVQ
jgi:S1-C subfamily serine protease